MRQRNVDELLFHWAAVMKAAETPWAKSFAESVEVKARKPWWRPTAKQEAIMQRMVAELFGEDDSDLIERDMGGQRRSA